MPLLPLSHRKPEKGNNMVCKYYPKSITCLPIAYIHFFSFPGNAYIMTPPKNTTVSEGQRVKLTCQAEGYPNNITYRWYKNGVDVQGVNGLMSRAGVYADGSFVISNVIKDDYGWYKCRPSNGLGPPPEASAYLNVTCKLDLEFRFSSVFLPYCVFRHFFCHIATRSWLASCNGKFDGEMFMRTQPKTLLQIFCEFIFCFFKGNSICVALLA